MKRVEFYTKEVKAKAGVDRTNEYITKTGWYPDNKFDEKTANDKVCPQGRVVEILKKISGSKSDNAEGITYYTPKVYLEIKTKGHALEKDTHSFVIVSNDWRDKDKRELCDRFPMAFEEFEKYRGYENNAGQKGAIKTKYLTETGEITRDYNVKKS
jgi:hypothetical protein